MKAPIRSMTGFARAAKATDAGEIAVTLKSVNHRGLDLHFHLPAELDPFENAMRTAIKKAMIRGHVDVRASVVRREETNGDCVNEPLLKSYLAAFRKIAAREGLPAEPDLNAAFRIPGMFEASAGVEADSALEGELLGTLGEAIDGLNRFREREGAELADFIRKHNRSVGEAAAEIEDVRSRALPAFQNRLNERLKELLRNVAVEPQRLVQEAALLADRSDIGEELSRLRIHSRQIDEILDAGGEVGKRLDFLLQEMNRETNTMLSKTTGIGEQGLRISDLALAVKADTEKIREQALNLE
jgi:uncharacterized protein (TIGR00255 family)